MLLVGALVLAACGGGDDARTAGPEGATTDGSPSSTDVVTAPPVDGNRWILGYYPMYQRDLMPFDEIDWSGLTHLVVGRVVPRTDGTLDTTYDVDPTTGPQLARDLVAEATAHDVPAILMVGGAGAHDGFAAAGRDRRDVLVRNLLSLVDEVGYEGIDLDWEPVDDTDQPHLLALAQDLRRARPELLLTVPVGWTSTTFPDVPAFYGQLAEVVDRIELMTYGMAGPWGWQSWHSSALHGATPTTPSAVDVTVSSYRAAGVPAAKLAVGIGFYGMCWNGGVDGPLQDLGGAQLVADDNVMSYTAIQRDYVTDGARRYDASAEAPYLAFDAPHGPRGCTFVSYEDEQSIRAKGAWAADQGLGGALIWTINQAHVLGAAPGSTDPLLRTTREAFGA